MHNRISTGVLIFKEGKLLLIKHVNPSTGYVWWVPPGGGIKEAETIFEAAEREVMEEAGMVLTPKKLVYIRQFIYPAQDENIITIYMTTDKATGKETIENIKGKGRDSNYIKEIGYFSKKELKDLNVFPQILKGKMWDDYEAGFPEIKFIGVDMDTDPKAKPKPKSQGR